jgi:hypothetical protein
MTYKLYKTINGADAILKTNEDGSISSFILGLDNPEEEAYLKWIAEGNEPLPADK